MDRVLESHTVDRARVRWNLFDRNRISDWTRTVVPIERNANRYCGYKVGALVFGTLANLARQRAQRPWAFFWVGIPKKNLSLDRPIAQAQSNNFFIRKKYPKRDYNIPSISQAPPQTGPRCTASRSNSPRCRPFGRGAFCDFRPSLHEWVGRPGSEGVRTIESVLAKAYVDTCSS